MDIDVKEQSISDISPDLLKILLSDKTTKKFIRWGTDNYKSYGPEYYTDQEMKPEFVTGSHSMIIRPRVAKETDEQVKRTRDKAEVFTPSWVCNEQNNLVDEAWFGRKDVFNKAGQKSWVTTEGQIEFPRDKIWKDYIDARRMEISCGEAPYLASRYDTVTGNVIPLHDRIGLIDRKMRILNENAASDKEWNSWCIRAFQSCYGYDFSGDNVLLARENLLYTYVDYYQERYGREPSLIEMKKIANIVAWNIWQMNGITMTAPYSKAEPVYHQMTMFELIGADDGSENAEKEINEEPCRIFDWRSNESLEFRSLVDRG